MAKYFYVFTAGQTYGKGSAFNKQQAIREASERAIGNMYWQKGNTCNWSVYRSASFEADPTAEIASGGAIISDNYKLIRRRFF
jgi:hypothetical protein